ncbi:SRPBCC domain-containing protein [Streptomyces sp. HNS054]|uniref:SRPBCC domain-containing protein n=1 Tax=Streptomyces sp. HNS054 TaxID=1662446 RepID=UPI0018FF0ACA|nr:SRPBCC domain-containing protein [Streptomyces sp. HNS054]WPW20431.1 SRPBCC domain-containing protein [Streptomyces griseoincarnatus]
MEHEVFVPVDAQRLREVLDDPARVARAVPGLQHDAGAEPVTGRLKVRIGGSSITYRGSVRVSAQDDGVYAVEGEASESRGDGTVRLSLRLTLRPADAGTALVVTGTATADGRVTDLPQDAVTSAVTRLLNRFTENLATAAEEPAPPDSPEQLTAGDVEEADPPESPEQLAVGGAEDAPGLRESPEQLGAGDAAEDAQGLRESPEQLTAGDAAENTPGPPESPEQLAVGGAEDAPGLRESPERLAAGDAAEDAQGPPESPEQLAVGDFEPGATTDFETTPDAEDAPPPPPQQPSDTVPDTPSKPATASGPSAEGGPAAGTTPAPEGASGPGTEPGPDAVSGPEGDASPGTEPASDTTPAPEGDGQGGESAPDAVPGPGAGTGPEPASPRDAESAPEPEASGTGPVPPTPEPLDAEFGGGIDGRPLPGDDDDDSLAEAAHARRTMIGRSAEEVDHAPPRGRYAPVPAPQTVASSAPLRWAAPAAALAVASAVVAIRALRRRR